MRINVVCVGKIKEKFYTQAVEEYSKRLSYASKDDPRNQDEIGENELLVVSFGTSFNDSRVADIKGVEDALAEANPDWSVRRDVYAVYERAFTVLGNDFYKTKDNNSLAEYYTAYGKSIGKFVYAKAYGYENSDSIHICASRKYRKISKEDSRRMSGGFD